MAIQCRRGVYGDFDPQKMLPGEWAIVTSGATDCKDGRAVYVAFAAGAVKRLATVEDMAELVASAVRDTKDAIKVEITNAVTGQVQTIITNAENAIEEAEEAAVKANAAAARANAAATEATSAASRADASKAAADAAAQHANEVASGFVAMTDAEVDAMYERARNDD